MYQSDLLLQSTVSSHDVCWQIIILIAQVNSWAILGGLHRWSGVSGLFTEMWDKIGYKCIQESVYSQASRGKRGGGKCDSRVSISTTYRRTISRGKFFNVAQHLCQVGRHRPYKLPCKPLVSDMHLRRFLSLASDRADCLRRKRRGGGYITYGWVCIIGRRYSTRVCCRDEMAGDRYNNVAIESVLVACPESSKSVIGISRRPIVGWKPQLE